MCVCAHTYNTFEIDHWSTVVYMYVFGGGGGGDQSRVCALKRSQIDHWSIVVYVWGGGATNLMCVFKEVILITDQQLYVHVGGGETNLVCVFKEVSNLITDQ